MWLLALEAWLPLEKPHSNHLEKNENTEKTDKENKYIECICVKIMVRDRVKLNLRER